MADATFNDFADSALIRQRQMLAPNGPVPFGSSTLWRRVQAKTFPQPVRLSDGRCTCWRVSEIRAWLLAQGAEKAA